MIEFRTYIIILFYDNITLYRGIEDLHQPSLYHVISMHCNYQDLNQFKSSQNQLSSSYRNNSRKYNHLFAHYLMHVFLNQLPYLLIPIISIIPDHWVSIEFKHVCYSYTWVSGLILLIYHGKINYFLTKRYATCKFFFYPWK